MSTVLPLLLEELAPLDAAPLLLVLVLLLLLLPHAASASTEPTTSRPVSPFTRNNLIEPSCESVRRTSHDRVTAQRNRVFGRRQEPGASLTQHKPGRQASIASRNVSWPCAIPYTP